MKTQPTKAQQTNPGPAPADISPEEMEVYRASARRRRMVRLQEVEARYRRAWETARRAAALLKEKYGIRQVWVFGSLVRRERFHSRSDIDLAVPVLDDKVWLRAVRDLLDLDPEFSIDLVELEHASPSLRATVYEEGEEL